MESEQSDLEEVLLAIRKKIYFVIQSDYNSIVQAVLQKRKNNALYWKYRENRAQQMFVERRFRNFVLPIQKTSLNLYRTIMAELKGTRSPVYSLRSRVVNRENVRMF